LKDRILIVDDEPMICRILADRLTTEGYSCTTAHNGKEALQHFCKDAFPLIISDIRMPEMDGIELLKRVKSTYSKTMVIMVTASQDIKMAADSMRFGADDLILKPIDFDLLFFSVKKALEKKKLEEQLESYHQHLRRLVEDRTGELQEAYRFLKKAHLDSVKILTGTIDAKDPYTRGHSDRVSRMSVKIGENLGLNEKELETLEYGALLHDIGKIGIKDEVLQKPGPLSFEEYQHVKEHPLIAVRILEGVEFFVDKIPMIRHHHEHFDGTGYPDGLAGEAIPIEARIIAVADAFDAMISERPHRRALFLGHILAELEKYKGKQFDPSVLEIFLNKKIYEILELER
jgi:putative two-component system response regulator